MSKTSTVVVWAVIVIIVVVAIVWFVMGQNGAAPSAPAYPAPTSQNAPAANVPSATGGLTASPSDTSNAALNQDLTDINNQLNGLASDTASIDQGLNDQPVPQGQ
jgi:hypothetical protein